MRGHSVSRKIFNFPNTGIYEITCFFFFQFVNSRDFQFRVKGISMSVFTEDDVKALSGEGNVVFNEKYLHNYNTSDPLPTGADVNKLKEFIKSKYLDKRWHRDSGAARHSLGAGHSSAVNDGFGGFDGSGHGSSHGSTSNRASTNNRKSVSHIT